LCGGLESASMTKEVIPVTRKRTYRVQEVKGVNVARLASGREGMALAVGLDVSKAELIVGLCWEDRTYGGPWRAANPGGIRELISLLQKLGQGRQLIVAMEPTGTYGDPVRQALTDAGLTVHRVNGKAVHDYAEVFDGVPSQHDGKDALMVAELAALGKSSAWPYEESSVEDRERGYWVDRMDSQAQLGQLWTGRLEGLLARHWPEVTELLPLNSVTLQELLAHYGGPAGLAAADEEGAQRLSAWGGAALKGEKIAAGMSSARETLGVRQGEFEARQVRECATQLLRACREQQAAMKEVKRLCRGHAVLEAQSVAIGPGAASVLWVLLGDPREYHSGEAYRKAMGLNLKERSSGKDRGQLKITKRGPGAVRRWLFMAALREVQEVGVREWYEAKKARDGGRGGRALVGVMRKLALALYRMAVKGEAYDRSKLFPGHPLEKEKISARARQKGPPLRAFAVTSTQQE